MSVCPSVGLLSLLARNNARQQVKRCKPTNQRKRVTQYARSRRSNFNSRSRSRPSGLWPRPRPHATDRATANPAPAVVVRRRKEPPSFLPSYALLCSAAPLIAFSTVLQYNHVGCRTKFNFTVHRNTFPNLLGKYRSNITKLRSVVYGRWLAELS